MLTARGRRTITLGLIAAALGRILGVPELFGLATAVVVVALAALVRVRLVKGTVTVSARAMPPVVTAGEPAVLELTIEASSAGGSLSSPVTLVTDNLQGPGFCQPAKIIVRRLPRGDRARASFGLFTERRGPVDAGAYEAVICDPFGLARRRLAVSRSARCLVRPRVEPLATALPKGLSAIGSHGTLSAVERRVSESSMLRRYAQGDDLRRVHWRTTARVGDLMVRDGGTRDEPDRIAITVLLDVGDNATSAAELDRAVEVAASVLSAAADESSAGVSGAYRLLTTAGLDTGGQWGHENLQNVLLALAGVAAVRTSSAGRFSTAVEQLGRPDDDEALLIVGAFGERPPDPAVLADLAWAYSAVVLVLVGAACSPTRDELEARLQADARGPGSRSLLGTGFFAPQDLGGRSGARVLTVPLPLGASLAAAWSLGAEGPDLVGDGSSRPGGAR